MGSAFLLQLLVSFSTHPSTPVSLSPSPDGHFLMCPPPNHHHHHQKTTTTTNKQTKPECPELRPELLECGSPKEVCASRVITLPWKILCRRGDNLHIVCTTLRTCVRLFNIFRFELCLYFLLCCVRLKRTPFSSVCPRSTCILFKAIFPRCVSKVKAIQGERLHRAILLLYTNMYILVFPS